MGIISFGLTGCIILQQQPRVGGGKCKSDRHRQERRPHCASHAAGVVWVDEISISCARRNQEVEITHLEWKTTCCCCRLLLGQQRCLMPTCFHIVCGGCFGRTFFNCRPSSSF